MFEQFGINAGLVEELYNRYLQSPGSVEMPWRNFFATMAGGVHADRAAESQKSNGDTPTRGTVDSNGRHFSFPPRPDLGDDGRLAAATTQGRVYELLNAYRVRGHLFARLNPLGNDAVLEHQLALTNFGLSDKDLDTRFPTVGMYGLPETATLREIVAHLEATYCESIGVEYTQIEEPDPRHWLEERMESTENHSKFERSELVRILTKLTDAEIFEQFIHKNYFGAKRFSLEGAESMIAMLDRLIETGGQHGVQEIVIGMAHRGRLNVMVNILQKNVRSLFAAFDDKKPEAFMGRGDVKYHLGYSNDVVTESGAHVHLSLAFNPSHLEWVNPVVEGRVRAKQDRDPARNTLPLLIHGDAAFIGQGVVPETLNLAGLHGYSTGGTIHVVVNNQIGFTTNPSDSRSTRYCTDIARMMRAPVFHVNGEDPEALIQVTRLAVEFREKFHRDVVIDMFCYRKYGHNENDEPRFTQPLMYALIDKKPTVREVYVNRLVSRGHITREEAGEIARARKAALEEALVETRKGDFLQEPETMGGVWARYAGGRDADVPDVSTTVPKEELLALLDSLATVPAGFHANAKALRVLEHRRDRAKTAQPLDWGGAEHLAFATILKDGHGIRLSGQDAGRGTFSHRHAVLIDTETGARHVPLEAVAPRGARFEVWDSPLSEAGVLGFEFGYSLDQPEKLVIWEAQFGDFLNTAQVVVDQFITSAEDKWRRLSGLVLLLPHGYEGQGPEHSSARVERFLQLCAEDNIQVCNLTTPAQFFHLLRRQVHRQIRKPLVVFTPKSLLRHPDAVSQLDDLSNGKFLRAIGDSTVTPSAVKKILVCSGKVYFDLAQERAKRKRNDVAIIRLEQLYPLTPDLRDALAAYGPDVPVVWVQEEPRNMGACYFLNARKNEYFGKGRSLSFVTRAESASPATGSNAAHALEQNMLLDEAFSG